MSASKLGESSGLRMPWDLQRRGRALEAAAIERPRGNVSPTDGYPEVLCAAVCAQAGKATAFMCYMRIVKTVSGVDRQLRVAAGLPGSTGRTAR